MELQLTAQVMRAIQQHGQDHYPEEGAGLLLGELDEPRRYVTRLLPLDNTFAEGQQQRRYLISPETMIEAEKQSNELDLEILGVFHSHPDHPARPSEFDRTWAWPWFVYIITSVMNGKATTSRAWLLKDDRSGFDEIPLHMELAQEET